MCAKVCLISVAGRVCPRHVREDAELAGWPPGENDPAMSFEPFSREHSSAVIAGGLVVVALLSRAGAAGEAVNWPPLWWRSSI